MPQIIRREVPEAGERHSGQKGLALSLPSFVTWAEWLYLSKAWSLHLSSESLLPLGRVFGKIGVPSLFEHVSYAKYSECVLLLFGVHFSSPRQMALLLPSGKVTKREGPGILPN